MNKYRKKNPPRDLLPENPEPHRYRDAVVIPVLAENDSIGATLDSIFRADPGESVLKLLVVNHNSATGPDKIADNQRLLARLRANEWNGVYFLELEAPEKGGVGYARKIGCDSVLPWIDGLIFHLDGDTTVEEGYFRVVREAFGQAPEWSGASIRFRHPAPPEPELARAIALYERYLDSYVAGLAFAGSPYAYHAMGSAMVCRAEAYQRAGGMRVRAGGEDFYFLQALRKVGVIGEVAGTTVHPAARASDRVPFGTGPRLREIVAGKELAPYAPELFDELKKLLTAVELLPPESYATTLPALSPAIAEFMNAHSFPSAWSKILENSPRNDQARREAFHWWFDAFRTLKFIHGMVY